MLQNSERSRYNASSDARGAIPMIGPSLGVSSFLGDRSEAPDLDRYEERDLDDWNDHEPETPDPDDEPAPDDGYDGREGIWDDGPQDTRDL